MASWRSAGRCLLYLERNRPRLAETPKNLRHYPASKQIGESYGESPLMLNPYPNANCAVQTLESVWKAYSFERERYECSNEIVEACQHGAIA